MQLIFERITKGKGEVIKQYALADGSLLYELTAADSGDSEYPISYSVSVRSTLSGGMLEKTVPDLTVNRQYALEFFELLVLYAVTPVTLCEVAEDFIVEKYSL